MKETILIFLSIGGLFFALSLFSSLNATTSTQIQPPEGATTWQSATLAPQLYRCYGGVLADSNYVQTQSIDCTDNQINSGCQFSDSSGKRIPGYIYGFTYNCSGGDTWNPCSPGCSMLCGSPTVPVTNCDWK